VASQDIRGAPKSSVPIGSLSGAPRHALAKAFEPMHQSLQGG